MKQLVRVWNVVLKNGPTIKVATIEQGERKPSPLCEGCYAKCCRGSIAPVLTAEEFLSRKFKFTYMTIPDWIKKQVPNAECLAILDVSKGVCPYFNQEELKCGLWPNPPEACLAYDCRKDPRKEMRLFAKRREKEWRSVQNAPQK